MVIPESARAVLESDALGHLVTINPDGSPQVSVIWVGVDGDEIIAAHVPEHRDDLPAGFVTHITVDKISGVGPWVIA